MDWFVIGMFGGWCQNAKKIDKATFGKGENRKVRRWDEGRVVCSDINVPNKIILDLSLFRIGSVLVLSVCVWFENCNVSLIIERLITNGPV